MLTGIFTSHHSIGARGLRTHCFALCGSWESKLRSSPLRDKPLALRYLPSLWPLCGGVVLCLFVCSQAGFRLTEILLLYLQSAGVKDVHHHFRGALELLILLLSSPRCWDYKHALPCMPGLSKSHYFTGSELHCTQSRIHRSLFTLYWLLFRFLLRMVFILVIEILTPWQSWHHPPAIPFSERHSWKCTFSSVFHACRQTALQKYLTVHTFCESAVREQQLKHTWKQTSPDGRAFCKRVGPDASEMLTSQRPTYVCTPMYIHACIHISHMRHRIK